MKIFAAALIAFLMVILFMAVGVIFKRRPISGSCGGLNNFESDKDESCSICGASVNERCKEKLSSGG